jgi:hypothetical protein
MWTLAILTALAWNAAMAVFLASFVRETGVPTEFLGKLQFGFTVAGIACSTLVAFVALVA